ncbi:hypothetical protein LZV00_11115 [Pseudomonas kielensis]|uniref:hypothetical protein n=1 Tax=Pseudomonas kielensis TaxID=2762577 RepID=UPI00223FE066|nr:hypothetical protein [Pseudomonas kielensis]UZM16215.1 hypothetical protein LZV00_11115 [Pseudomonas kielensis]
MAKVSAAIDEHSKLPLVRRAFEQGAKVKVLAALRKNIDQFKSENPAYLEIVRSYFLGDEQLTPVYFNGRAIPNLVAIGHGDFQIIVSLKEGGVILFNAFIASERLPDFLGRHLADAKKTTTNGMSVHPRIRAWFDSLITTPNQNIKFENNGADVYDTLFEAGVDKIKSDLGRVIYTSEEASNKLSRQGLKALVDSIDLLVMLGTTGASPSFQFWSGFATSVGSSITAMYVDKQIANDADRNVDRENAEQDFKMGKIFLGVNVAIPWITKLKAAKNVDELSDVLNDVIDDGYRLSKTSGGLPNAVPPGRGGSMAAPAEGGTQHVYHRMLEVKQVHCQVTV